MMDVRFTDEARNDFFALPLPMKDRVESLLERLARWPDVSGAKPLVKAWRGHYRLRTGDYRLIFRVQGTQVLVVRIANRKDVYED